MLILALLSMLSARAADSEVSPRLEDSIPTWMVRGTSGLPYFLGVEVTAVVAEAVTFDLGASLLWPSAHARVGHSFLLEGGRFTFLLTPSAGARLFDDSDLWGGWAVVGIEAAVSLDWLLWGVRGGAAFDARLTLGATAFPSGLYSTDFMAIADTVIPFGTVGFGAAW